jgi:hypothetical protein
MAVFDLPGTEADDSLCFSPVPNGTNAQLEDGIEAEIMACLIQFLRAVNYG